MYAWGVREGLKEGDMLGDIGFGELLVIFLVALLFFGAKRLPDLAGSLGKSVREFKKGMQDMKDDVTKEIQQSSNGAAKSEEKTTRSS